MDKTKTLKLSGKMITVNITGDVPSEEDLKVVDLTEKQIASFGKKVAEEVFGLHGEKCQMRFTPSQLVYRIPQFGTRTALGVGRIVLRFLTEAANETEE